MEKMRNILTLGVVTVMAAGYALWGALLPDQAQSRAERRNLQTWPELAWSEETAEEIETYFADQMPLRHFLRTLKGELTTTLLGKLDNGGYYRAGEFLCKTEYPLDEKQVAYAAQRLAYVYETYLSGKNLRWAVIPDKGYYAGEGRLQMDYSRLIEQMEQNLPAEGEYVDLFELLTIEDYYYTDTHWRQEKIFDVADALLESFGCAQTHQDLYAAHEIGGFTGAYYGQSGLAAAPETLTYLTSPITDDAVVTSAEVEGTLPVYTLNQWEESLDGYNIFLNGPQAVLTVENPHAASQRELILIRDSFGSSIAPLLMEGYSKITLVDLRYIAPDLLPEYVDLESADDVLMLFSVQLLNAGRILK